MEIGIFDSSRMKKIWFENSAHLIPCEKFAVFLIPLGNEVRPFIDKN